MMPVYTAKAGGFFFIMFGVIVLIAVAVHDQPDLELRTVRPVPRLGGHAARLVHRLRRRRAATRSARAGSSCCLDRTWSFNILVPLVGLGSVHRHRRDLPVHRGAGSPATSASTTSLDRPRNAPTRTAIGAGWCHVLRGAVGCGKLRHHRDALLSHDGRRDPHAAGAAVRRPVHRLLRHEARLHRAAEEGPRDRAARLRVRSHRPPPRWRVHRGAPARSTSTSAGSSSTTTRTSRS